MKATTKFSIGGAEYTFEVDDREEMETLNKIITLSSPPKFCDVCYQEDKEAAKPADFKLTTNKDKEGNVYVNVKHRCGATAKLGQYKTGSYFWKRPFEKYVPKEGKSE